MRTRVRVCREAVVRIVFLTLLGAVMAGASHNLAHGQGQPQAPAWFNPNKIISDTDFLASATMTPEAIEQFLHVELPREAYAGASGEKAAETIYDLGQRYGINPQVLLIFLKMGQVTPAQGAEASGRFRLSEPLRGSFSERLDRLAQRLQEAFESFSIPESLRRTMTVNDGRVQPRNAATAGLYSLLPWIGQPQDSQALEAGLYQFRRLWVQWFDRQPRRGEDGACTTITPQTALQTISGTLTTSQFREWCFTAAARQVFEFSTCPPEGSATFETAIEVLNGDGSVILAAEFFTAGCSGRARLTWAATSAGSYRVRLRPYLGRGGSFTLGYRTLQPPVCAGEVTPTAPFQGVSNSIAAGEFKDYCFVATAGLIYDFTTCPPGSADFDTVLEIRDDLGRTVLAYNDDFCDTQSYISWRASDSGRFRVRVYGFGSEHGNFALAYRVAPTPPCNVLRNLDTDFHIADSSISAGEYEDYCFDAVPGKIYEFETCAPGAADFPAALEIRTTWEYDPETRRFTSKASMPNFRGLISGVALAVGGRLVVHVIDSIYSAHFIYDVVNNTWGTATAPPLTAYTQAVVAIGRNIYVVGGSPITRTQIYDTSTRSWSQGPYILRSIGYASGAVLDNFIYMLGGSSGPGSYLNTNYSWMVE